MRKKLAPSIVAMVVFAITGLGGDPSYRTNRYCLKTDRSDRWKPSRHRIKVLLHESLLDICGGHPASCQSADLERQRFNIERSVRTALADFHNAGGANLRFDFRGWTRSPRLRDDTIVIAHQRATSPEPCPVDQIARAGHQRQPWYLGGDDRGVIFFCTQMIDGQRILWIPWDETFTRPERLAAFIPTVKHEMLHVLGLSHSDTCSPALEEDARNASVMRTNGFTFMHLAREDVRFLRDHFGPRKNDGRLYASTDGLTWSPAASPPSAAAQSPGRPAMTNSREGSNLYMAWRDSSENSISVSRVTP